VLETHEESKEKRDSSLISARMSLTWKSELITPYLFSSSAFNHWNPSVSATFLPCQCYSLTPERHSPRSPIKVHQFVNGNHLATSPACLCTSMKIYPPFRLTLPVDELLLGIFGDIYSFVRQPSATLARVACRVWLEILRLFPPSLINFKSQKKWSLPWVDF